MPNPTGSGRRSKEPLAAAKLYELVIENALDYAIFTLDGQGKITNWSPGAAAVFGWTSSEVIGRSADFLFTPEDLANGQVHRELTLARETGVAADVRWHIRKDGSRVFIEGWMRALQTGKGQIRGFLKVGQDVTRRRETDEALRRSEERFRSLVVAIPQLVFRCLVTGDRTWGSPQWEVYTGLSLDASIGFGWLEAIHPDDREATLKAWETAKSTGQYYVQHRVRRLQNADYRWHQTRAVPLPDTGDSAREWVGTSTDVHELLQLQEQQSILVAELQHRTRNLLGIVQSLMQQTAMTSPTTEEFSAKFSDRLTALSRVQGLLTGKPGEPVTIGSLLRMELEALGADIAWDRVQFEGPQVPLPSGAVQTLALALHELATNARKYGALAHPEGLLQVSWRVPVSEASRKLRLEWIEKGLKPQTAARRKSRGFGLTLIEQALPRSLGAKTRFEINSEGAYCEIELPLE
jgi:PAS domain S-box-containing protein